LSTAAYEINNIVSKAKDIAKMLNTNDLDTIFQYMQEQNLEGISYSPGDQSTLEHEGVHKSGGIQTPAGLARDLSTMLRVPHLPAEMGMSIAKKWVTELVDNLRKVGYPETEIPSELAARESQTSQEFQQGVQDWISSPEVSGWLAGMEENGKPQTNS